MIRSISVNNFIFFESDAIDEFCKKILDLLSSEIGSIYIGSDDIFLPVIKSSVMRARSHGLMSERHAAAFVVAGHFLGVDFDTAIPECASVLTNASRSPQWKVAWLEAVVVRVDGVRGMSRQ